MNPDNHHSKRPHHDTTLSAPVYGGMDAIARWEGLRPLVVEARRAPWPARHWVMIHGSELMWLDTDRRPARDLLTEMAGGLLATVGCGPLYLHRRAKMPCRPSGTRVGVLRAATPAEVLALAEAAT